MNEDTRLLRAASEPEYARLRELLPAFGCDPDEVLLAEFFPDDPLSHLGIVVKPDGQVFRFDLNYSTPDSREDFRTASIINWRDVTETWPDESLARSVRESLETLHGDRGAPD